MSKIMKTMDGNQAAAEVSYQFSEVANIFPITPSSPMAEHVDEWAAKGKKNMFGQTVKVVEMQSEGGAAGALHGALATGALATTYTASQGLLLMVPNMYKIAGELLPCVIHVSARTIAAHALSIFGDHSDVMACRQTGFAMLASSNVQEVMDLSTVSHLSTLKARVPFLNFFDGFRTSHEIQKIEVLDFDKVKELVDMDAIKRFKDNALNPQSPVTRGTAQNPDVFFQAREASNKFYNNVPAIVEEYLGEINKLTGRDYKLFNYYGDPEAEKVIIAIGSVCDTISETIDFLRAKGEKVGLVNVHLFRPFVQEKLLEAIPTTAKKIAVLDRTKEPGALGEPLYQDVCTAFFNSDRKATIVGGRYGLSSKDTTPAQIIAVYENLDLDQPKNGFTVGINDDVTHLSLKVGKEIDVTDEETISCKFWGLGADGTVGANKNSIKIIGDHTDMYAQAYFAYDSKKSGGLTTSHLRFGKKLIRAPYLVTTADFIACHQQSYLDKYDILEGLKEGGSFLLNTKWNDEELDKNLPGNIKRYIAENKINFYTIDAVAIAKEIGLGKRFNAVLQSAFFKIANIIPADEAIKYMKEAIVKAYGKKGEKVVAMNQQAVEKGMELVRKIEVPSSWANAEDTNKIQTSIDKPEFITRILEPINNMKGDLLPVSAFVGYEDGTFENGTAAYEKRGVAIEVPEWNIDNCIQCNQCSYVCPHAVIRPFLVNEDEAKNAPEGFNTKKAIGKGFENYTYRIQVSVLDCTGCGNCVEICPAKEKAIVMKPIDTQMNEVPNWEYAVSLSPKENPMDKKSIKGSQFEQPLFEFSGACPGCGETPYAKLITQLFGDRMYIANATGCSSIWGGSAPSTPYTKNHNGHGPAWANSLFEDNAEFGLGMAISVSKQRQTLKEKAEEIIKATSNQELKDTLQAWIDTMYKGEESKATSANVIKALENETSEEAKYILEHKKHLVKNSQWIFGGDGWAYDIGYGGLDHALASGEDINVFVFDTEIYSNTGGQASKSTPTAAIAKFAASGKRVRKKDLGMMAMSYGYVYVAQVSMGADKNQVLKAIVEAESYPGPSLIIAYAPCISHGINMTYSLEEAKKAVECGYWQLYRFNPTLEEEGKNPFILDSKEPTASFKDFLSGEVRYTSLQRAFPELAEQLFDLCEQDAKKRLDTYKKLADA
ncbi:pyruvate:ferredoxin (flavodoxin) oxidoreductase [[Clostridium] colinum]|uniref:pyruvate:ferredoxin (flavodoxin) oxidoreductase n=1 Tax=[Clostridium] colinum TaxID=36835 RepID=UPI002025223B|nr:pyruvate:ferredoxin (flavodoxin) oxidoreductase [[Clostridium] colinum]